MFRTLIGHLQAIKVLILILYTLLPWRWPLSGRNM